MAESSESSVGENGERGPSDSGSERGSGADVRGEGQEIELPLFSNPLTSFEVGAITDLRFRMACDFIKSEVFGATVKAITGGTILPERAIVGAAMDMAAEIVRQGIERGWVKALPDTDELPARVQRHLKMGVRAQVMTQRWGQEIAQREDPGLMRPVGHIPRQ